MTTSRRSRALAACCAAILALTPLAGCATEPAVPRSTPVTTPSGPVATTITTDLADRTIDRYGKATSTRFVVTASGTHLSYRWESRRSATDPWKAVAKATKSSLTVKSSAWANGTLFRVTVTGDLGRVTSREARLTIQYPSRTPAADAMAAFGLEGLTQGVDLSSYQYEPGYRVKLAAVAQWAGPGGFVLLRNASGARPIKTAYPSACTGKRRNTGKTPLIMDCAYPALAQAAAANGLARGHYWFNGWINTIDTTDKQLFAGGFTPKASAQRFVKALLTSGQYTQASTDPLVLDIEPGHAWSKTVKGKTIRRKLRAWNVGEASEFLTTVRDLLTSRGYQANLYVYMSANRTKQQTPDGTYAWGSLVPLAKLWVASWGSNNGRIPPAQPEVGPWADRGWSIWQYSANARISGSGVGALDGDIAKPDAWTP